MSPLPSMDEVDRYLAAHQALPHDDEPAARGSRHSASTRSGSQGARSSDGGGHRSGNPAVAGGHRDAGGLDASRRIYDNIAELERVLHSHGSAASLGDGDDDDNDDDDDSPVRGRGGGRAVGGRAPTSRARVPAPVRGGRTPTPATNAAASPAQASDLLNEHLNELQNLMRMQPFAALGSSDAGAWRCCVQCLRVCVRRASVGEAEG